MTYRDYSDLDIVEVFIDVQNELGYPPTVKDLSEHLGACWNTIDRYLHRAELNGEMRRITRLNGEPAAHRAWRLEKPKPPWNMCENN